MAINITQLMYARLYDYTSSFAGKIKETKDEISVPVIMAKEMIQYYHISEIPEFLQSLLPRGTEFVTVLKPFEELQKAIDGLSKLFINTDHEWIEDIKDPGIIGYVNDFKSCDQRRLIYGRAHYFKKKLTKSLYLKIKKGEVIDVSIGATVMFSGGGMHEGQQYMFKQINIDLNHLATLEHSAGRCPAGICGLNLDSANNLDHALLKAGKIRLSDQKTTAFLDIMTDFGAISKYIPQKMTTSRPIYESLVNTHKTQILEKNSRKKNVMSESELAILKQQLLDKDLELQKMKDSQSSTKIADLDKTIIGLNTKIDLLTNESKIKDEKITQLETAMKIKDEKIAKHDSDKKAKLVSELFMVRDENNQPLYKKEDLEQKSLDVLEIMAATAKDMRPSIATDQGTSFPKPGNRSDSNHAGENDKATVKDAVVDVNALFAGGTK